MKPVIAIELVTESYNLSENQIVKVMNSICAKGLNQVSA